MELKTYDEWNDLGYYIKKGSKSCARNQDGKALFSSNQIEDKVVLDADTASEYGLDIDLPNR